MSQKTQNNDVTRRAFLRKAMYGTIGLFTAQAAVGGLVMFWPARVTGFGARIQAGHVDDYQVGDIKMIREGRFYLSRVPEGFIALWWKCPHLGCTVPWNASMGIFRCPCHASTYDVTGQNIAGPAPRPMDYMAIEITDDGQIWVDSGNITEREYHRPEHVTRWPA